MNKLIFFIAMVILMDKSWGQLLKYNHEQWQFENRGKKGLIDTDIDLVDAWKITTGGKTANGYDIVIAIIDRGVNTSHPDLQDNIWVNPNETLNGLDDDGNGYIDDINGWDFKNDINDVTNGGIGHFHGTPINGIIGAVGNNGFGVSGVNHSVKLLNLIRGEDSASILKVHRYVLNLRKDFNATKGAKGAFIVAINNSWGFDSLKAEDYTEWCKLYDELGEAGILTVNSVPNLDIDIDIFGDMPATCSSDFMITVTNSDYQDTKIPWAGYGQMSVDLAAPGELTYTVSNTGDYGMFGGTSAAAPYVSGTIALLYSTPSRLIERYLTEQPNHFALIIKKAILDGVVPVSGLEKTSTSGGRLNVYNSLKNLLISLNDEKLLQKLKPVDQLLSLYPNPSREKVVVTLELVNYSDVFIDLFDMNGKKMNSIFGFLPGGIQSIEIPTAELDVGNYLVVIRTNTFQENLKLIKSSN